MHRSAQWLFGPFLMLVSLVLAGCKGDPLTSSSSSSSSSGSSSSSSTSGIAAGTNHKFYVGNITQGGTVHESFKDSWNQLAPEVEGRWESVEHTRNVYNWKPLDAAYNYAKQNDLLFLQYGLFNNTTHTTWAASLTPQDMAIEAEEWVKEYCARYPATDILEVASEALKGHSPSVEARRAFGENWLERVYQLARNYCPNAVLILSDFNILKWETQKFIELAKPLARAGLIDGIGIIAHGIEDFPAQQIQGDLDTLWNELQVPIYISSYYVARVDDAQQLNIIQQQFPIFYQHPHVKGITFQGYLYGKSWTTGTWLLSTDGTPRPAMNWLMDYLKQNPK